jgi:beta-lactam-binding protein with PASTA domain
MVVVPDLCGLDHARALDLLRQRGLQGQSKGQGLQVCHQQPQAGFLTTKGEIVVIDLCSQSLPTTGEREVPQVVGLTLREAIWQYKQRGLDVNFSGSGVVVKQTPPAGQKVAEGVRCFLECQPSKTDQSLVAVAANEAGVDSRP